MLLISMKKACCKACKKSTPKMGVVKDKMYRFPKKSVPAMGLSGGKRLSDQPKRTLGTDIEDFFAGRKIGKRFEQAPTAAQQEGFDKKSVKGLPPGARRWSKGTYKMPGNDTPIPIPSMGCSKTSIPKMGPVGAVIGGYLGKKLGNFIGSAGKRIGPKHDKYGRQAGEYIGGTLGAGIGLAGFPF